MSEHEWILSVLEDLGTYAQRNNLPALGMTIKQARRIAKHEICEHARLKNTARPANVSNQNLSRPYKAN